MIGELDRTPGYFNLGGMVFAFFCFGPFMLPLVWLNPKLDTRKRILATVVVLGVTAPLVWAVVRAISSIVEYYQILSRLQ